MKKTFASCMLTLLFMSACAQGQSPQVVGDNHSPRAKEGMEATQAGYGLFGPGPINYGAHRQDTYRYDGQGNYTGTSFHNLSPERQDLGDDQEIIQNIAATVEGVNPGMVIIAGSHAWLNVKFDESISKDEQKQKINQVKEKLEMAIPRYQIHFNGLDK